MLLTVFTGGALYITCSLEIKVFSVKSAFGSCLLRSTLTHAVSHKSSLSLINLKLMVLLKKCLEIKCIIIIMKTEGEDTVVQVNTKNTVELDTLCLSTLHRDKKVK